MRNQIPLKYLCHFKSITLSRVYLTNSTWNTDVDRRTKLFEHILKVVISQCIACLDLLEVAVQKCPEFFVPMCSLLAVLNTVKALPISTLKWSHDMFEETDFDGTLSWVLESISKKCVKSLDTI